MVGAGVRFHADAARVLSEVAERLPRGDLAENLRILAGWHSGKAHLGLLGERVASLRFGVAADPGHISWGAPTAPAAERATS